MFHKVYENSQWSLVYSGRDKSCNTFSGFAREFGTAKLLTISTKQEGTPTMKDGKYFSVHAIYLNPLIRFLESLGHNCERVFQNDDYCLYHPISVGKVYFKSDAHPDQVHEAYSVIKQKVDSEEQKTKDKRK